VVSHVQIGIITIILLYLKHFLPTASIIAATLIVWMFLVSSWTKETALGATRKINLAVHSIKDGTIATFQCVEAMVQLVRKQTRPHVVAEM